MINLKDTNERSIYFHNLAEECRSLELLLHTCYNVGIIPKIASKGHGKHTLAYITLNLDFNHLNTIGRLIDLTVEIPDSEFNIKSTTQKLYAQISCNSKDNDQLFTKMNEIIEEDALNKKTHNLTLMNTIYNLAKIINDMNANMLFATNEHLYNQGKCGISIYKDRANLKKTTDISKITNTLKQTGTLKLPSLFICSFEQLRNFYFELDETVYGDD